MKLRLTEEQFIDFIKNVVEQVEETPPKLLHVPHYLQSDDSTCGPASLRMVFAYYGLNMSEEDIAEICQHTYELGCKSEDMECAAKSLGFEVYLKNNSTIDELEKLVNAGVPVIVDWFCGDPPEGHSSVVIGVSNKNIYILDPYLEEMRVVPKEDFRRCWFDFYETPITPQNLYVGQIMVIRPKNNLNKVKSLKESIGNSVDAILVGGLDYRSSDYPITQQVEILKKGLGSGKNVKGFRYNTPTSEILDFLSENPNVPVFLFSAGARKAESLSKSPYVDPKKLFVIEPFAASSGTKSIVRAAVSNGVPAYNVFVGGSSGRGKGVVDGESSSQSDSHWGALTSVGRMKSGLSQIYSFKPTSSSSFEKNVSSGTQDKPTNVKKFQTWLDQNHEGWHQKYGKLNDDINKGWGIFGPNTKKAWANTQWRKDFLKKENNSSNITEQISGPIIAPNLLFPDMTNLGVDDTVDVISGAIDVVPGLGNLVSAGIDVIHTLTYIVRFFYSKKEEEKIENATLAIITLGATFIPFGGNSLPVLARQSVKQILRQTPGEIFLLAKKLGIYNKTVILLSKGKWKYSILLALAKIFGGELAEFLTFVTQKLYDIYKKIEKIKSLKIVAKAVGEMLVLLKELSQDVQTAIELVKDGRL